MESNKNRWGGDIGAGLLAYANRFGVHGDVRWFRASSGDNVSNNSLADNEALGLLSDVHFWRGTLGLAFRW